MIATQNSLKNINSIKASTLFEGLAVDVCKHIDIVHSKPFRIWHTVEAWL